MWKVEKQAPSFHLPLATFHCFPPFPTCPHWFALFTCYCPYLRICLSRRFVRHSLVEGGLVTAKSHHWGDEDGSSDSQGVPFNLKVDLDTGTYTRLNSVEGEIWKLMKNKKEGGKGVFVTWPASPSDWGR